jgi:hypothetical protein
VPRFFDPDGGERQTHDGEGREFSDRRAARREAIGILTGIGREVLPDGDERNFICRVRDNSSQAIFTATLSLKAQWHAGQAPA